VNRRKLLLAVFGAGPIATVCLLAKDQGKAKGKVKNAGEPHSEDQGGDHDSRYFRREDYAAVQRFYTGPRDLPPGLRKKYYRTGKLPPGWQKKLQPFPTELVRILPPPPPNCERGYIDGVAVVYDRTTRIILDSIDMISAITGR
jgi:hypothetical protein